MKITLHDRPLANAIHCTQADDLDKNILRQKLAPLAGGDKLLLNKLVFETYSVLEPLPRIICGYEIDLAEQQVWVAIDGPKSSRLCSR